MGREIKRVALDFDWPMNKPWEGYLSPDKFDETPCPDCYGQGSTPAMQWIDRIALMLDQLICDLDNQARGNPMHPWLTKDAYPPRAYGPARHEGSVIRPTKEIIEFAQALVKDDKYEHSRTVRRGFLASNKDAIARGLIRAADLPEKWGWCTTCNGHGSLEKYAGQRAEADAWEPTEPPEGDGWQVWETVSEGSPISPAFADREQLIEWLTSPAYTWGISRPLTREQAEAFVGAGHAVSMVMTGNRIITGDAAVHELGDPT